jgi:hypothetical protein
MKKNTKFIVVIFILLICEICSYEYNHQYSLLTNNFRVLSYLTMCLWYYQREKENFNQVQKLFVITVFLRIFSTLATYLMDKKDSIIVSVSIHVSIFLLTSYIFKRMGGKIKLYEPERILIKLIPTFLILPLVFYFFLLYPKLFGIYTFLILIYILVLCYTALLLAFLPINEKKRLWIICGSVFFAIATIIEAQDTFLEKLTWSYSVVRTLLTVSICMAIYGMIDYNKDD